MRVSLFSLLLLLTPVDDAVAWSTPEVDDDVVAAANNHYLTQGRTSQAKRAQNKAKPILPQVPRTVPVCPPAIPSTPHAGKGSARSGTLYTFMSLQR